MTGAPAEAAFHPPGLLVVDADPDTRSLLHEFFAHAGLVSEEASDLGGALARLAGRRPAAVVVHDRMGGPQGLELLQLLRSHHPDLPIVFIARPADPEARAAAGRLAVSAYVEKPFRVGDLLAAVLRTVDDLPRRPGSERRVRRRLRVGRTHAA